LLADHPLRTQLICMINANAVVNALGPTFVSSLVAERGVDVGEVVRAYRIAVEVTGADALWEAIEGLSGTDRAAQMELLGGVDSLVESTARWYLTWAPGADLEETITTGREGFDRLAAVLSSLGTEERRRARSETVDRLVSDGVPSEVAVAHALRAELVHAPDMVAAARSTERTIEDVARVFFALGVELRLDWMERELARVRSATRMQRWALQAVREDAFKARRQLAESALTTTSGAEPVVAVERFLHDHASGARRLETFLRALAREGEPDLAGLALAVRQLGTLVTL
jgi:glutamate dehydrogenase